MLKASGATLAALSVPGVTRALAQSSQPTQLDWDDEHIYETVSFNQHYNNPPMLGRVESFRNRLQKGPYITSESVRNVFLNYIMPIYGAVRGDAPYPYIHNDVWYITENNHFVHSSYIVPSREQFNQPVDDVGDGFWGELTVPLTWLRVRPSLDAGRYDFRAGYGTVYRVIDRVVGDDGVVWYQLEDDFVDGPVKVGFVFHRAGDDQWGSRLIDQDGVNFVDDREIMSALNHGSDIVFHVVAQIVEAEFIVGAVCNVGSVCGPSFILG